MIRILAVCLVLIWLAFFGIGAAHAQASCSFPTEGQAYAAALDAAQRCAAAKGAGWSPKTTRFNHNICAGQWQGVAQTGGGEAGCAGIQASYTWGSGGSCSSAPIINNAAYYGATFCSNGCAYQADDVPNNPNAFTFGIKDKTITQAKRLRPTGQVCSSLPTDPPQGTKDDVCVQQGTLTQCVTPDGKTCSKSSSGKMFCWEVDERGTKTSGNEASTKVSAGQTPNPPPVPPKNGGDWQNTGEGSMSITDNRTNTTNNYTTNNWNSNYGSSGSGASGGGSKGEGNGGSGDGSGEGNGEGEGEGNGPGGPGGGVGDLYTSEGKTVAGVFGEFKARVGDSPLISAIRDFFTVNAGGACPVFSVSASTYWEAMTYDGHCSGDFLAALRAIGWVLMAIAALAAAYWALS